MSDLPRREDANIRVPPRILDLPIANENDQRFHPNFEAGVLPNQVIDLSRIAACLG